MYSILVAEDERPIARNIKKTIESLNSNFEVTGMAYNGKQAMDLLIEGSFDVAFLDINMPLHNGLEILEYVKENKLTTVCVILTGYQDFDYAQRAIHGDAIDYLTKPLNLGQLENTLEKLQRILTRKQREKALYLKGRIPHELFEKNLDGEDSCYIGCLLFSTTHRKLYLPETIHIINETIGRLSTLLNQIFGESSYWITQGHESVEYYLFVDKSIVELEKKLKVLINRVQSERLIFGLCLSELPVKMTDVNVNYKNLKKFLVSEITYDYSYIAMKSIGESKKEENAFEKNTLQDCDVLIKPITSSATFSQAKEILIECISICKGKRHLIHLISKYYFSHLCSHLPSNVHYFDIESEILEVLENTFTVEEIISKFEDLINNNFFFHITHTENKEQLAQMIHDYIENNYQFPFSNQLLSEKFGFVPYYLSRIFKEMYGQSPNEYIMHYRIEKSKGFLERNMLAKDVAALTGFNDPLYFSKVFKKATGITPTEYSKMMK